MKDEYQNLSAREADIVAESIVQTLVELYPTNALAIVLRKLNARLKRRRSHRGR